MSSNSSDQSSQYEIVRMLVEDRINQMGEEEAIKEVAILLFRDEQGVRHIWETR